MTYSQPSNGWGLALTLSLAIAANACAYAILSSKSKKPMLERKEFVIAWGVYEQKIAKVETYVKENAIFLQSSTNLECNGKGLEIVEAYYGLDEHILLLEAGLVQFSMPTNIKEYYDMQVVPLKRVF